MSCNQKKKTKTQTNTMQTNKVWNKYKSAHFHLKREFIETGMHLETYEPAITSAILVWKITLLNKKINITAKKLSFYKSQYYATGKLISIIENICQVFSVRVRLADKM